MMRNGIIQVLGILLLLALFSCESEIKVPDTFITVEQFTPVQEGNKYIFSGRVNLPQGVDKSAVKVGFWISSRHSYNDGNYENAIDAFEDISDYQGNMYWYYEDWLAGDTENYGEKHDYWVEDITSDGSFSIELALEPNQYMCKAFAMNIVEVNAEYSYDSKVQVVQSKPFYFSGSISRISLNLYDVLENCFVVSVSDAENVRDMGVCWSDTDRVPNIEYKLMDRSYRFSDKENEAYFVSAFDDRDVVYLRAYVLYAIQEYNSTGGESSRIAYSDVLEFHPKEQVFIVNNRDDLRDWISQHQFVNPFRGTIQLNYALTPDDWKDSYGNYSSLGTVNYSIKGNGTVFCREIGEMGYMEGVTLLNCENNYGTLKNVQLPELRTNYGQIIDSDSIYIESNRGVIQNCTRVDVVDNYGIIQNSDKIEVSRNYGLVQNCRNSLGMELPYNDGNFEEGEIPHYTGYWSGSNLSLSAEGEGCNSKYCLTFGGVGQANCSYDFYKQLPAGTYELRFAGKSNGWSGEFTIYFGDEKAAIMSLDSEWREYTVEAEVPYDFWDIRFTTWEYHGEFEFLFWIDDVQLGDAFKRYSSIYMVESNGSRGQIIGCSVEDDGSMYICGENGGLIKNCTPVGRICENNNGVIQNK